MESATMQLNEAFECEDIYSLIYLFFSNGTEFK